MVTDHARAEVGVLPLDLTEAGKRDPVFGPLGSGFPVVIGHEDIVDELPHGAVSLASSATIENEALMFSGKPIYATQFHPELFKEDLIARIAAYPPYLQLTGASSLEELRAITPETPGAASLVRRFVEEVLGGQGTPVFRPAPPRVAGRGRVLPTETKRGDGLERRPPVGTAARRAAGGSLRSAFTGRRHGSGSAANGVRHSNVRITPNAGIPAEKGPLRNGGSFPPPAFGGLCRPEASVPSRPRGPRGPRNRPAELRLRSGTAG